MPNQAAKRTYIYKSGNFWMVLGRLIGFYVPLRNKLIMQDLSLAKKDSA